MVHLGRVSSHGAKSYIKPMRYFVILTLSILLLIPAEGVLAQGTAKQKMNVVSVIFPYRLEGVWVFDDATKGLVREAFISGADKILDVLTEHIPNAADGFKILFSARPFPGYTARFVWTRAEYGGNWYQWPERQMEGWLCPALLKYFESPPKEIFVQISAKSPMK
jgi:uncharacterized protein DUF6717